jgi:peptidoglycan hydrolase CwlO-like protein
MALKERNRAVRGEGLGRKSYKKKKYFKGSGQKKQIFYPNQDTIDSFNKTLTTKQNLLRDLVKTNNERCRKLKKVGKDPALEESPNLKEIDELQNEIEVLRKQRRKAINSARNKKSKKKAKHHNENSNENIKVELDPFNETI